ncbi:hypothetical protein [Curtobacterium sp. MCPF17_018]|uniref:hypothetical protein n=1 Tax=Curtobacterium sp. MCPF17_018 TaxID=2175638 RepID=UPI001C64C335|nr:hypothetical protein [Curtobacterium sp. MCPF17_018]
MIIQNDVRPEAVEIVAIDVEASGIVDLRDVNALGSSPHQLRGRLGALAGHRRVRGDTSLVDGA